MVPEGWPLTLGRRGLVLQLGELEASALRLGECYLCIRSAAAVATTSGSGEAAAGETVERNTVEVSHAPLSLFSLFLPALIRGLQSMSVQRTSPSSSWHSLRMLTFFETNAMSIRSVY